MEGLDQTGQEVGRRQTSKEDPTVPDLGVGYRRSTGTVMIP